jgi:GNAT superfamily N-acetyltransferase
LGTLLDEVAAGRPPPADMSVTVLPRPRGRAVAVVLGFTAHHVVAADVDPDWVRAVLPAESLSARMGPAFLTALAERVGAEPGGQDTLLVAPARPPAAAGQAPALRPADRAAHPRLERATRYRDDVRAWQADGAGLVVVGRGVAGRWEVSLEVEPAYRGHGLGRALAAAATGLVPAGAPLWAQVHPANVRSLRAFLAAGYRPTGAEVLFT